MDIGLKAKNMIFRITDSGFVNAVLCLILVASSALVRIGLMKGVARVDLAVYLLRRSKGVARANLGAPAFENAKAY